MKVFKKISLLCLMLVVALGVFAIARTPKNDSKNPKVLSSLNVGVVSNASITSQVERHDYSSATDTQIAEVFNIEPIGNPVSKYSISKKAELSGEVIFPSTYNGLPITNVIDFKNSDALVSVTLPTSLGVIGIHAFENCAALETVVVPSKSFYYVGTFAFNGCSSLKTFTCPKDSDIAGYAEANDAKVQRYAFTGCTSLQSVTLPDIFVFIEEHAFSGCTSLQSFVLPKDVTSIGEWAFSGCTGLKSVDMSNIERDEYKISLKLRIDQGAFYGCESLAEVKFTEHLGGIGESAFYGCSSLKKVQISGATGLDAISAYAFQDCTSLEHVVVSGAPEFRAIGQYAFYGCEKLTAVSLSNISTIGESAFEDTPLATINPSGSNLSTINRKAFKNTKLTSLTIPSNIVSIGESAFQGSTLNSLTIYARNLTVSENAFKDCTQLKKVTLSQGSINSIDPTAFSSCSSLEIVVLSYSDQNYPTLLEGYFPATVKEYQALTSVVNSADNSFLENENTFKRIDIGSTTHFVNVNYKEYALSNATISLEKTEVYYNGANQRANITVIIEGNILTQGVDYEVAYRYTAPGVSTPENLVPCIVDTYKVEIKALGQYFGSYNEYTFTIKEAEFTQDMLVLDENQVYTGEEVVPEYKLVIEGVELVKDTDYTVELLNNTELTDLSAETPTLATITLTGIGRFAGCSVTKSFYIKLSFLDVEIELTETNYIYSGNAITPSFTLKRGEESFIENVDYIVTLENNVNAGDATLKVTGMGQWAGTVTTTFTIAAYTITNDMLQLGVDEYQYTGESVIPQYAVQLNSVSLVSGKDFTVALGANVQLGTATITITGIGNYQGNTSKTFTIIARTLTDDMLQLEESSYQYNSEAITPEYSVSALGKVLVKDTDYTLQITNNVSVGSATITITGNGNYTGSVSTTFTITVAYLNEYNITINQYYYEYHPNGVTPDFTVTAFGKTLVKDTDYTVELQDNAVLGEATLVITGMGNFDGTGTTTFYITERYLTEDMIKMDNIYYAYTGEVVEPEFSVEYNGTALVKDADYTIAIERGVGGVIPTFGRVTVYIEGQGNFTGLVTKDYYIQKTLTEEMVEVQNDIEFAYRGTPITIWYRLQDGDDSLGEGTDFSVTYQNNNAPGTATITFTGIESYTGSVSFSFTIVQDPSYNLQPSYPNGGNPGSSGGGSPVLIIVIAVIAVVVIAAVVTTIVLVKKKKAKNKNK